MRYDVSQCGYKIWDFVCVAAQPLRKHHHSTFACTKIETSATGFEFSKMRKYYTFLQWVVCGGGSGGGVLLTQSPCINLSRCTYSHTRYLFLNILFPASILPISNVHWTHRNFFFVSPFLFFHFMCGLLSSSIRYWTMTVNLDYHVSHLQLHRTRSCLWLLDMVVCAVETARTRWHHLHCAAQATAHLLALVPSHHRVDLLVVLVHRIHIVGQMVHCDELLRTFRHVLVLCVTCYGLQATPFHCHGDHIAAIDANDCRLRHQHLGQWLPENVESFGMSHFRNQYQTIDCHVFQLLCAVC